MPCFAQTKGYATIVAVMARESWTDERLDDFKGQMNERFDEVGQRFGRVETQMKEGFARVDKEMKDGFARVDGEMKEGFNRVDEEMKDGFARVDGDIRELRGDVKEMQRLMIHGFIGIVTLMVTGFGITISAFIGIVAF
jgi:hypothetical protein